MNIILLGPPGAGKGTQAKKLWSDFRLPQISTGDILREEQAKGSDLGKRVKVLMDKAQLVPDEIVIEIVDHRLREPDCKDGFVLDGFPRTIPQAEALDSVLKKTGRKIENVIALDAPEQVIVDRITGRRTCPKDGTIYHVVTHPPIRMGFCDKCNTGLVQRADDSEEKARKRYGDYVTTTARLKPFYSARGIFRQIDGVGTPEGIYVELKRALGKS